VLQYLWIAVLLPLVMLAPNTQQLLGRFRPALSYRQTGTSTAPSWQPSVRWAAAIAVVTACGLLSLSRPSEFLYYQF
jgi:hypothetical protein